jgi:hypothetical protein
MLHLEDRHEEVIHSSSTNSRIQEQWRSSSHGIAAAKGSCG